MSAIKTEGYSADELAAGRRLFGQPWQFVKGVVALDHLPDGGEPEIAFAGRSNVGKSSLLNALTYRHGLARTSNTPGRTQEINFFAPESRGMWLVDMPGYGFAVAPKDKVAIWGRLGARYMKGRAPLARVFLLVDARHGLKAVDTEVMTLLDEAAVSYKIVLTKSDKINSHSLAAMTEAVAKTGQKHPACHPTVLATSAQDGSGLDDLRAEIAGLIQRR